MTDYQAKAPVQVVPYSATTPTMAIPGPPGAAGPGVPAGGATGQVLAKASGTDFDTEWVTGGGAGGYVKPADGIPSTDMTAAVQASLSKADTALQAAPVTRVNTKTGDVTLTAADVAAVPTSRTINGKPLSTDLALAASDIGAATTVQGAKADTAVQPGALAPVATSGVYADLSGKPTIPSTASEVGAVPESLATAKGDLLIASSAGVVGRLPVGTDGQVLTADSSQTAGAKWAPATGGGGSTLLSTLPAVGQYFTSPFFLNLSSHDLLNAPPNNALWIPLASAVTVDSVSLSVTTAGAAGNAMTVGLYADDGTGRPSATALGAGTVSIPLTATGSITVTFPAPITLSAPGVWVNAPASTGLSAQIRVGAVVGPRMGVNTSLGSLFTVGLQENGNPNNYPWTPMFVLHRSA